MIVVAFLSALVNVVVLAVIPFLLYFGFHRWRHKRGFTEVARRAGLQGCEWRLLGLTALATIGAVGFILIWPPPLEPLVRPGSPQRSFVGLGLGVSSIVMALLYGVVKTGFSEEFLFRGLIAGSLSRRLPVRWANLLQATVFLLPHLLVLQVMPEMWTILPLVFVGGLFVGWVRIRSGSILGPWLIHAVLNVATCLSVAVRTAP